MVLFNCYHHYLHDTDEETEAKSVYVTCLGSHICHVVELGCEPRVSGSGTCVMDDKAPQNHK